jgi:hypothetical protein
MDFLFRQCSGFVPSIKMVSCRHDHENFGGDASAVVLTGFSRGAIACGYLGMHDDETAK